MSRVDCEDLLRSLLATDEAGAADSRVEALRSAA